MHRSCNPSQCETNFMSTEIMLLKGSKDGLYHIIAMIQLQS